ncbi:MAG: phosphoenolpyruvate--protein phosphotransferase, partial [Alistipes sp.]|nr:phosphoenolpyruvate--protein phosphotransferase [Alistipes sp.]
MFVLSTAVVASHRVAIGRAFVVERGVAPRAIEACDRSALECFNEALAQSREQIESLACGSDIFEAH